MPLRRFGWRKRKRDDHTLSYPDAFAKTDAYSIRSNSAEMEDSVREIRGTHTGGASATNGGVRGAGCG